MTQAEREDEHDLENDEESEYWYKVNEYEKSGTVKKNRERQQDVKR